MNEGVSSRRTYTKGLPNSYVRSAVNPIHYVGGRLLFDDELGLIGLDTTDGTFKLTTLKDLLDCCLGRHIGIVQELKGDLQNLLALNDLPSGVAKLAGANYSANVEYNGSKVYITYKRSGVTIRYGNDWGFIEDISDALVTIDVNYLSSLEDIQDGADCLLDQLEVELGVRINTLNPSAIASTLLQQRCRTVIPALKKLPEALVVRTLNRALQCYKGGFRDAAYAGLIKSGAFSDDERTAFGAALRNQYSLSPDDTEWIESTTMPDLREPNLVGLLIKADVVGLPVRLTVGTLRRRTVAENKASQTIPVMPKLEGQHLTLPEAQFIELVGAHLENVQWTTRFVSKTMYQPFKGLIDLLYSKRLNMPILKLVLQRIAPVMAGSYHLGYIPSGSFDGATIIKSPIAKSLVEGEEIDVHSAVFFTLYPTMVTGQVATNAGKRAFLVGRDFVQANTDSILHTSLKALDSLRGPEIGQLKYEGPDKAFLINDSQIVAPGHKTSLDDNRRKGYPETDWEECTRKTPKNSRMVVGLPFQYRLGLSAYSRSLMPLDMGSLSKALMAEKGKGLVRVPIGPPGRQPMNLTVKDILGGAIYVPPFRTEEELYENAKHKGEPRTKRPY